MFNLAKRISGEMSGGGEIRRLDRGVRKLLGFDPDALKGRPATDLFRFDDTFLFGLADARRKRGRKRAHVFLEVRRADGGYIRTRATITPRFSKRTGVVSAFAFDFTPIGV